MDLPSLFVMPRRSTVALLAGASFLVAACGAGSGEASSDTTAVDDIAESTSTSAVVAEPEDSGSGGLSSSSGSGDSDSNSSSDSTSTTTGSADTTGGLTSEVAAQASLTLEDAFPPEAEACVLGQLAGQPDLLADVLVASEFTDLSDADQATVVSISLGCTEPGVMAAYMVEGFNESSEFAAPDGLGDCLEGRMNGSDGEQVIVGFIAIGNETVVPEDARQPLIDTLTECMSGDLMATAITASFAEDPEMENAVDITCVEDGYNEPGVMEGFWTAMVDNPEVEFEDLPDDVKGEVVGPILDCISFGAVIATEAAADGVTLSAETITCIDDAIAATGLMDALISGEEPDEAALGAALLGCLSADELVQLANS